MKRCPKANRLVFCFQHFCTFYVYGNTIQGTRIDGTKCEKQSERGEWSRAEGGWKRGKGVSRGGGNKGREVKYMSKYGGGSGRWESGKVGMEQQWGGGAWCDWEY